MVKTAIEHNYFIFEVVPRKIQGELTGWRVILKWTYKVGKKRIYNRTVIEESPPHTTFEGALCETRHLHTKLVSGCFDAFMDAKKMKCISERVEMYGEDK